MFLTARSRQNSRNAPIKSINENGVQRTTSSPNEHGNTLGNQPAELYYLNCIETGEPKKYGETTHG